MHVVLPLPRVQDNIVMAGTLDISENCCWMPAGWIYDNVLEQIASFIANEDNALANSLLAARTAGGTGYLDLRCCSRRELETIVRGAQNCLDSTRKQGGKAFYDSRFYPGFINQLESLLAMLSDALDDRGRIPNESEQI
jgi:hypothetical protein